MTYETIDWDAEAKRIVAAFDVAIIGNGDCYFVRSSDEGTPYYYLSESGADADEFVLHSMGYFMAFIYTPDARFFYIGTVRKRNECFYIGLHRDGTVTQWNEPTYPRDILAQGVFHLGLLTPEVEAALGLTYSDEKRQQWESDYEVRLSGLHKNPLYENLDWEAEAKRIIVAFDLAEPCRFKYSGRWSFLTPTERDSESLSQYLKLKSGYLARITYDRDDKHFALYDADQPVTVANICDVIIGWDGSNLCPPRHKYTKPKPAHLLTALAKALFLLDLLTPEIEEALGMSITAHQKMDWAWEYEERMKSLRIIK